MGFVGSILGADSGNTGGAGLNYQAGSANIANPTNPDQLAAAYTQSQTGLAQQQAFLQALQGQNGIQNQTDVYNQLQGIANGTGPNPAQAMLANSTGQNTANQAALMAGQRGAGANVGLIARQAAMQGAVNQQNAVGQGAALQAQQSQNAINSMGGISGQQIANQAGALQGYNQAAQSEQQNLLNAHAAYQTANVANMNSQNAANSSVSGQAAQQQGKLFSNITGASGTAMGLPMAHGGQVPVKMAEGGIAPVMMAAPSSQIVAPTINQSGVSRFLYGASQDTGAGSVPWATPTSAGQINTDYSKKSKTPENPLGDTTDMGTYAGEPGTAGGMGDTTATSGFGAILGEAPSVAMTAAHGGKVPAILSPGERYLSPKEAEKVAAGKASPTSAGKKVPGKATVKGDSSKNDTVPATLEEGGVVIPRSVMNSKDPAKEAAKFVQAVLAKGSLRRK